MEKKKRSPSIVNNLYSELGIEDCDKILNSICENCSIKEPCDANEGNVPNCNALNTIIGMMIIITIDETMPGFVGHDFVERLKKVIANRC